MLDEDDPAIAQTLADALGSSNYRVWHAENGADARALLEQTRPDLIILDLMLPEMNGYQVLRTLREGGMETPVLILTARDEEADKVLGFRLGADDYVLKPYSLRELVARVRARLRRQPSNGEKRVGDAEEPLVYGDLRIDRRAREVHIGDEQVELTRLGHRPLDRAAVRDGLGIDPGPVLGQADDLVAEPQVDQRLAPRAG